MASIKIELYDFYCSLPKRGWLHECLNCSTITSSTIIYDSKKITKDYIFKIYICPKCKQQIKNSKNYIIFAKKMRKINKSNITPPLNQTHLLRVMYHLDYLLS